MILFVPYHPNWPLMGKQRKLKWSCMCCIAQRGHLWGSNKNSNNPVCVASPKGAKDGKATQNEMFLLGLYYLAAFREATQLKWSYLCRIKQSHLWRNNTNWNNPACAISPKGATFGEATQIKRPCLCCITQVGHRWGSNTIWNDPACAVSPKGETLGETA